MKHLLDRDGCFAAWLVLCGGLLLAFTVGAVAFAMRFGWGLAGP